VLIDTVELTLSHVDLGELTEFAAMTLFGNAISHRIVLGTDVTVPEITDSDGNTLYPSYFMTHLKVPHSALLSSYKLWDRVAVGVNVRVFGGMILESSYLLGRPDEIPQDLDLWNTDAFPSMTGGTLFVVEESRGGEPKPSVPRGGLIAEMPKLAKPPASVAEFATVQTRGSLDPGFKGKLVSQAPIRHAVATGRDLAPGHALMFASFGKILDHVERTLLADLVFPPFPTDLINHLSLLERQTFYLNNCYGDQVLLANVRGRLTPSDIVSRSAGSVPAATLTMVVELYEQTSRKLLVSSKASKLFALPSSRTTLLRDMERLLFLHGED